MRGFVFLLAGFFILVWLFSLFFISYKTNNNIIFYQNELLDKLEQKENKDFIITGLKIIIKNSKTKEEFMNNLRIWSLKVGFNYKLEDFFVYNNTIYFYSNNSLFRNYLEIEYKGKKYIFKNLSLD